MNNSARIAVFILQIFLLLIFYNSCDPLVTQFEDFEPGVVYTSSRIVPPPTDVSQIKVMTWNIRFGIGRIMWFGDTCGERVLMTTDEVMSGMRMIADKISELQPDIVLLQEIDISSKRSAYVDQLRWLLDNTYFNYGAYASTWKAQYIPSDGLGRMDAGNAILSRWNISDVTRIQFPRRGDQDGLTKYFYLQYSMLKARIEVSDQRNFYVLNAHLTAFSTDDTKKKQVDLVIRECEKLDAAGIPFILGGDFNLLSPTSDSTDYCLEDSCPGESFHNIKDDPMHKEGSYYTPEIAWLQVLYDRYKPAVSLQKYTGNQRKYFTHSTKPDSFWDRTLDYLFSNRAWVDNSELTHQDVIHISDHAAVSAKWWLPK